MGRIWNICSIVAKWRNIEEEAELKKVKETVMYLTFLHEAKIYEYTFQGFIPKMWKQDVCCLENTY